MAASEADRARPDDLPKRRHPPFFTAVIGDALITSAHRGHPVPNPTPLRSLLAAIRVWWAADTFAAQVSWRLETRLRDLHVPILPRLLHWTAVSIGGFSIAHEAHVAPGLHVAHGQIVVEGHTEIERGVSIFPFATIGPLEPGARGPTLRSGASIGTGAKVLGPIVVGDHAWVGANAVVVKDVAEGESATGVTGERRLLRDPQRL